MTHRLDEKWIWDFWFALDGSDYHVFYLQAPRSLEDPNLRHTHATIGHAVSTDLCHWDVLPDALFPANADRAWDNFTTWTGSVIDHQGRWYLFYTGTSNEEKRLVQRIGLATSDDLLSWKRYKDNPMIEVDPRWYETLNLDIWHEQAWRDPYVFHYDGRFHALLTARANRGDPSGRGVIGYACSDDLIKWDVQAPITEPGEFGNLEVPQIVQIGMYWYVFFSVEYARYSKARCTRPGIKQQSGIHYLISEQPFGPYTFLTDDFLLGDKACTKYSGKVIQNPKGDWVLLACNHFTLDNKFQGEISEPIPIRQDSKGRILINTSLQNNREEDSPYEG